VGWTYPARNPITRSKSIKISSDTRIPLGPVRPVDPTGQTGRLLPDRLQHLTGQTARVYRSDRAVLSNANFNRQHVILLYVLKQAPGTSGYRLILVSLGS